MKPNDNKANAELNTILGPAKYYIDTPISEDVDDCFWFPTIGDSMTDNTARSIPGGSLVLARLLKLNSINDVPLHRPIVVIIHYAGEQFCLLKSPAGISTEENKMLCLRSYNPSSKCDDLWVPFSCVKFIFVVEKVRLPNGKEFVPKKEEITRKAR